MLKTVELYKEPIDIFDKLGERYSELSDTNLAFICGLIKEFRPMNIVEVGVSAGGTSCVILNCLDKLNMDSSLTSVDLSYTFHKNKTKKCGFQIQDAAKYLKSIQTHKLFLGKRIVEVIQEIVNENGKIDMLILDTVHFLPGELLDFLVCFPFLSNDAIVILDDVLWAHGAENTNGIATRILFDSVVADKFTPASWDKAYMVAFQLNEDTSRYLSNCFFSLFTPWHYQLENKEIEECQKIITNCYDEELVSIFSSAVNKNNETLAKKKLITSEIEKLFCVVNNGKKTYIYGAGERGKALAAFIEDRGAVIDGFILSDDRRKSDFELLNKNIYYLKEFSNEEDINIIVAAANREIINNLERNKYRYAEPKKDIYPFIKEYNRYLLKL